MNKLEAELPYKILKSALFISWGRFCFGCIRLLSYIPPFLCLIVIRYIPYIKCRVNPKYDR